MHVTARENKKNEGKVVLKMSSDENNTNVEKTEEAPPVPEFENPLANLILKKFPSATIAFANPDRTRVNVSKEEILQTASFIRDELHFDHAESVSGVDYPDEKQIEVVYHLGSYDDPSLSKANTDIGYTCTTRRQPTSGK
jgi:NADH:ubiquinone oxidoreductase subunit C